VVDKTLMLRKVAEIDQYLRQLDEFTSVTVEDYGADWKVQRIVERTLQMTIETCADVANHIISDSGFRVPTGYADTFRVLFEHELLDEKVLAIMERMAKFRNIIVHRYDTIDAAVVTGILKNHLQDFQAYKNAIVDILK
jgi:uncharacterized protein YutE (UPF0331/DUF86 family)